MRPKSPEKEKSQSELFRSRLDQILNHEHPMFVMSEQIDWERFEEQFGLLYCEDNGRPGIPIRTMVGLHYLKHAYNESDETVVERFLENPYWQYFCGYEYFQHEFPIDPSSMTRWRKRVGKKGIERLLKETIDAAKRNHFLKRTDLERVNVDTTVQEKAIAFPTDARLYQKARSRLVKEARKRGIELRQSYVRVGRKLLLKQSRYAHAKQYKRARKCTRRLKTILGRVIRDIRRSCVEPDEELAELLELSERLVEQKRKDKNKIYSIWAPEVECISKGKAHKRYEFGCKVSLVSTSKKCWVVGVKAFHGNPYDGHTIKESLGQMSELYGSKPKFAFVDKGYRGAKKLVPEVEICMSGKRKRSRSLKRWMKRRAAIEPVIGHMKKDNKLHRNHLIGTEGDHINAMLAGCGFNFRKLLREFSFSIFEVVAVLLFRFRATNYPQIKMIGVE